MFLKMLHYSQENTCIGVSLKKIADLQAYKFIKIDSNTVVFHMNIAIFLRAASFIEHLR